MSANNNPYFSNCFVCSDANPIGLHLTNTYVDGKSHMELDVHENLTGLTGLMHGGFTCMLLDEIMYYAMEALNVETVTVNMNIDFIGPARVGHRLIAEGWIKNREGRKIWSEARITDSDTGEIVASAEGFYLTIDLEKFIGSL